MLERLLSYLVVSSLAIGVVRRYLALNKLWIRRKERAVAESISVAALLLALATSLPFLLKNFVRDDYKGVANELMWVLSNVFMLLVGIGLWVPGKRETFWTRFARALRLERTESTQLLRSILHPKSADLIVRILHQIASIDDKIDDRERAYIERFATTWGIAYPAPSSAAPTRGDSSFSALRSSLVDYLAMAPPKAQIAQLKRVIEELVKIDDVVSAEEELILSELFGMLDHHVSGKNPASYCVVLVPQSREQQDAIRELVPDARKREHLGGNVFVVATYFSESYAEMSCRKYRSANLLTLVIAESEFTSSHLEASLAGVPS